MIIAVGRAQMKTDLSSNFTALTVFEAFDPEEHKNHRYL